jgi:predicted aspartyl protease
MRFSYTSAYRPPAPIVEIQLGAPDGVLRAGTLQAIVDTGADMCLVPFQYIEPLDLQIDDRKFLRSQWGERRPVDIYVLDIGIGDLRLGAIEVIADDIGDEIILGRNLLNQWTMILNGSRQFLEIVE